MTKSTFDRWLLGAAGLIALLVAAAALNFQNTRELNDVAWWVAHTHEVMDAIGEVRGRMRESEAAQRTFLVVGGDAAPPEFAANIDAAKRALAGVKTLTADNAAQQDRLPDVENRIDELAAFWTNTMTVRREQGFDAARQIVAAGESRRMIAELDQRLEVINEAEQALLRDRNATRDQTYRAALATGLLSGAAGVAGVVAFMALLRRHLKKRAADAAVIAEQSERLRTTLASIGDAVIATDNEGRVTNMNPVAESLTGWTTGKAMGLPLAEVFRIVNEDTRRPVDSPAERVLREGVIVGLANHTILLAKDGAEHPIDDSAAPIRCKDGQIVGCVLVFRDVAERRRQEALLRQSEARKSAMFRTALDCIISIDHQGRVIEFNPAAEVTFGYRLNDVLGKELAELIIPPALRDEHRRGLAHYLATGEGPILNQRLTLNAVRADGGEFPVELAVTRNSADNPPTFTAYLRDITERQKAEHEQKKLEENLRQYAAELSEADRRKNEFLAMLAHELRNPLAPIRNSVQTLRMTGGYDEAVHSASEMMERQLGQLVRLVDDLLDVSRINRGKIELRREVVELASIIRQAAEAAESLSQCQDQALTITLPEAPVFLEADSARLTQVVGNLLNNACKFTQQGGRIELVVERDGDQAVIRVRDNGIGIAAEQLPRIFDMFMQVDTSLERNVSGLGIGLTLVKSLVAMHGGTVEAHSEGAGRGSEFVVRLPVSTAPSPPSQPGPERPPTAAGRRILVVDDNRDSATSLATLLQLTGNETHAAYDGLEAVEATASFRPDVVLLDIGLPKLNGYEVARKIREQPRGQEIALIALTGWGQEKDRKLSQDAGFDGHMVKPVEYSALMNMLAELRPART